jgi:16S rRNA (uracil1498-N3)-methyltransferase
MNLPFFYSTDISAGHPVSLDADNSKHIVQVLRMKPGERIRLTDGRGTRATAEIIDAHKSHCTVRVIETETAPPPARKIKMAVSLLKQPARLEWFLEKATEIGVSAFIPLICSRTEKQQFREERWRGILISAMLQSQQCYLPELHTPVSLQEVLSTQKAAHTYIGYCGDEFEKKLLQGLPADDCLMLIGPEGDFTAEEIRQAMASGSQPVSLGENRLRTETAALVSCILLNY